MKKFENGQTLVLVLIFIGVISIISMAFLGYVQTSRLVTQRSYNTARAMNVAEAGINKTLWCLNHLGSCSNNNNLDEDLAEGQHISTTVTPINQDYTVLSTGTVGGVEKKVKVTVTKQATETGAEFFYGVQVGAGGLTMDNGSHVEGNVYSNGTITGSPGTSAYITGDTVVAGGTALTPDQTQLTTTLDYSFGCRNNCSQDLAQSFKPATTEVINKVRLYLKKVSTPGNFNILICEDNGNKPKTTDCATGEILANQVTTSYGWIEVSLNTNPILNQGQTYWIVFDAGQNDSKYYQTKYDNSGYANGFGLYNISNWDSGSWNNLGGDFAFQTLMGGVITKIDKMLVGCTDNNPDHCSNVNCNTPTGSADASAHQILNSLIKCDAYYANDPADIQGTTVKGVKYNRTSVPPNLSDPPPEDMPISDTQISQWKTELGAGDTIYGDYILDGIGAIASLGPTKITGNLTITNKAKLTVTGSIWVVGNVTFDNLSQISLATSYHTNSGLIMADGKITISNNCEFFGSGEEDSYIMVLSTNNSKDLTSPAIKIDNNAEAVIFYASQGLVNVKQNALLREVTAYQLHVSEGAAVLYESGLANAKFTHGPGGIWVIKSKTWQEIK